MSKTCVYHHAGFSGMNTFKTEVFKLDNGQLEVVFTRIKRKRFPDGTEKEFVDQVSQFTANSKEELKGLDLPKLRSTKILLDSDFFKGEE
ncbi:hypothetical protein [Serratia fonticola]|uniref:hypothetical protein n=1 Tax=Serratia fonticola TaxID=47917 RepID=UPI0009404589|nr:hypothetical protein [Serratia fonticola]OKP21774.1 hypothetical protein BSQ40_25435 [Serratia fonticola]